MSTLALCGEELVRENNRIERIKKEDQASSNALRKRPILLVLPRTARFTFNLAVGDRLPRRAKVGTRKADLTLADRISGCPNPDCGYLGDRDEHAVSGSNYGETENGLLTWSQTTIPPGMRHLGHLSPEIGETLTCSNQSQSLLNWFATDNT